MNLLSPRAHGYVDYAIVALLVIAPLSLGFDVTPAVVCYMTALAHVIVSLLTDYPLGASRQIPFPVHGAIELSFGAVLVAAPWVFRFSQAPARSFSIFSGISVLLLVLATTYVSGVISRPEPYDRYDR
jgi:hypothetical protein